jgi:hypothetical protein
MAVLAVIVLLLSRIFAGASQAWALGTRQVDNAASGRASMDFMTRELAGLLADDLLTFRVWTGSESTLGAASDRIAFVSLTQIAENRGSGWYRDVQQIYYFLTNQVAGQERFYLCRTVTENETSSFFDCYQSTNWWSDFNVSAAAHAPLAENVRQFRIFVFDTNEVYRANYNSASNGPPAYMDLYLELLGEADATRAADMPAGAARDDFVLRRAHRFVKRIHFGNQLGGT